MKYYYMLWIDGKFDGVFEEESLAEAGLIPAFDTGKVKMGDHFWTWSLIKDPWRLRLIKPRHLEVMRCARLIEASCILKGWAT